MCSATDAVNAAGSPLRWLLKLSVTRLLECCEARPGEAREVLLQEGKGGLGGVDVKALIRTGMDAETLKRLGHTLEVVMTSMRPSPSELAQLGFRF